MSIEQFRKGFNLCRVIEDIAWEAANAAEMKEIPNGNELIFLQVQLTSDLRKLAGSYASFQRGQHQLKAHCPAVGSSGLCGQESQPLET